MKILVTGAAGFVGSNLLRELLNRNHEITAFCLYSEDIKNIKELNVKIKYGDLLDKETIAKAIHGCEALIHVAAITSIWPYRSEIQKKVNIEGTRNVMQAAIDNNIYRVVHVGTANSFGFGPKNSPGDETKPYTAGKYQMDYMDTKYEAHKLVLKMIEEQNLPAVIVNPTFMFGPYTSELGCAKMIESVYYQKLPGYTKGGRNYVSVKDVCVAIANALTKGKIGESYILGNENLSYNELFSLIAKITGKKAPKLYLPEKIVLFYGLLLTIFARVFKTTPEVNYRMAQMSCDDHYYSAKKAVKELDLPQTPVEEAIKETFEWMKPALRN